MAWKAGAARATIAPLAFITSTVPAPGARRPFVTRVGRPSFHTGLRAFASQSQNTERSHGRCRPFVHSGGRRARLPMPGA